MTIDWNKPVQTTTSKLSVERVFLPDGTLFVWWHKCGQLIGAHVNVDGRRVADSKYPGYLLGERGECPVENLPPPKIKAWAVVAPDGSASHYGSHEFSARAGATLVGHRLIELTEK